MLSPTTMNRVATISSWKYKKLEIMLLESNNNYRKAASN